MQNINTSRKIETITQSVTFSQQKKKLNNSQVRELDNGVSAIRQNPAIGRLKKGNLKGVRVHKFRLGGKQYLLAYELVDSVLYLYALSSRENFYRDLRRVIGR